MSKTPHPHSAAVERVGDDAIFNHFGILPRAIRNWKRHGVPDSVRRPLIVLAATLGHDVPELFTPRDHLEPK